MIAATLSRIWRAALQAESLLALDELVEALPGSPDDVRAWVLENMQPAGSVAGVPLYRWGDICGEQTATPSTDELLTASELADRIGVPVSTVHRWTSDRRIPCFKFGHKTVRYRLADVLAAAEQTTAATEEHPHGRSQARKPLARRIPLQGSGDGPARTIPPYDWSQHDKARS